MSKGAETLIAKAELLAKGLNGNLDKVRKLGIDPQSIAQIQEGVKRVQGTDAEVAKALQHLTDLRAQNNEAMAQLNETVQTTKKIVKAEYDKTRWIDFGILDKQ